MRQIEKSLQIELSSCQDPCSLPLETLVSCSPTVLSRFSQSRQSFFEITGLAGDYRSLRSFEHICSSISAKNRGWIDDFKGIYFFWSSRRCLLYNPLITSKAMDRIIDPKILQQSDKNESLSGYFNTTSIPSLLRRRLSQEHVPFAILPKPKEGTSWVGKHASIY